jgi:hypothetical protein
MAVVDGGEATLGGSGDDVVVVVVDGVREAVRV